MVTILLAAALAAGTPQDTPPVSRTLQPSIAAIEQILLDRAALQLSSTQVARLETLRAGVQRDDAVLRNSSKPWVTVALVQRPADVRRRTLEVLDAGQRARVQAKLPA